MKKTTFSKIIVLILTLFLSISSYGQNLVPFEATNGFDDDIKGDILLIGNNVLGPNNDPFNDTGVFNSNVDMQYIDIDNDPTTFNSSSADLSIPNPNCFEIVYAALYWSAVERDANQDFTNVRFRGPTGGYVDVTGTVIYDRTNDTGTEIAQSLPYACFADVTDIVNGFGNTLGTYTVANVASRQGFNEATGQSAGWSLFVVYEDPTLSGKSITSFNGFSVIVGGGNPVGATVNISGFRTVPAPTPVRANFAFAALEGDAPIPGDQLQINGTDMSTVDRLANNFFNSSVTQLSGLPVNDRVPNSANTLGFDTGILSVANPGNVVIANDATSATVDLTTAGDTYFPYFFAMAVEIIEPNIVLTKIVEDNLGNDIGGQTVTLGDPLNYIIGFENTGNDDATNFTIRDILPINIVFDFPAGLTLPPGVTVQNYDPVTREIIFEIDNDLVEQGDPQVNIVISANVVENCNELADACSNVVSNQAFGTYQGTLNPNFIITDDPSVNSNTGCLLNPQATNFLADLNCSFEEEVILCGDSVDLTAADGYDIYEWTDADGNNIGNTQTITVTATGTYSVFNTAPAPCQSITQVFNVTLFGANVANPVIPFADEVVICPNDGSELPNIFLCGANDSVDIQTNIAAATSLIWDRLDESSCPAVTNINCANEDNSCTWDQVGSGPSYLADTAGQYRLTINFPGGCFVVFYFNVFKNVLDPTVTATDIICDTPGTITVGNVPSNYEFSLDNVNFQTSNIFSNITTAGTYTVYIIQTGVSSNNACLFTIPDIIIRERDFTVDTTFIQPLCNGDRGSIQIETNDGDPQYFYTIEQGGTLVNSVGPINDSNFTFTDLTPGTYTVTVETEDGCFHTEDVTIIEPPLLTVTAAVTTPLTCTDGEITIFPVGGTEPYFYFINSTTDFQTVPEYTVTAPGIYNITVVDFNNCSAQTTIEVEDIPAPEFTIDTTDILCFNETTGEIAINVINANGYTLMFSIDGVSFFNTPVFSNLAAGDYNVVVQYSLAGSDCATIPQTVTLNQPNEDLTAAGGVLELAGCQPGGQGVIRVTNAQGGTPFPPPAEPYEYSFDNQVTWVTTNEATVAPGTYTVYVRDANNCIFDITITLDSEPLTPTIDISDPDFNCDGSANATVTVNNEGSADFDYTYLIDGIINTNVPPNVFVDVPEGDHIITVNYTQTNPPSPSTVVNETFGTLAGGIIRDLAVPPTNYTYGTGACGTILIPAGTYAVASQSGVNCLHPSVWRNLFGHTTGTDDDAYLAVNGSTAEGVFVSEDFIVDPNTDYIGSLWAINGNRTSSPIPPEDVELGFRIIDLNTGNLVGIGTTGPLARHTVNQATPLGPDRWTEATFEFNSGTSTQFRIEVFNITLASGGNDFAIDDIRVFQLPTACATSVDFPFIVPSGNEFTADITGFTNPNCIGEANGTITIAAQNFDPTLGFQYSVNGAPFITATSSPQTITGLAAGTYNITIRFDDSIDTCSFDFTQILTDPDPLLITTNETDAGCIIGSTVTVSATGGTPNYTFQLIDTNPPFNVTNFAANGAGGILTDVAPGTYDIEVTDAFNCTNTTTITIDVPENPTATIDATSDFCFDSVDGASLVVNASGGLQPYQYSINGDPFVTNNTFTNLIPGTYSITVRDDNGCEFTIVDQLIAEELEVSAVLTKGLDCTATPDAVITGTITGGYPPYTYEVNINGGGYTPLGATTSPFTFTATIDGTYQFRITDSMGCVAESNIVTVNPLELPTATENVVNPSCNGFSDGSVEIIPSGGLAPHTISFNGSPFTNTTLYTGLPQNTYTYQISDANECIFNGTVTLTEPDALEATHTVVPFVCDATNAIVPATITVTATPGTGTANYQYSFNGSGFSDTNMITINDNGTDQTITYSVRDANGCIFTDTITLTALNPPTDLDFTATDVTCLVTSSTVTVTAINGIGTLAYSITAPAGATANTTGASSGIFTGLTPDTYVFNVTDENGCFYEESFTIDPVTNIVITGATVSDVLCIGENTGAIQFTVSGFTGSYSSTLTTGTGTLVQTGATIDLTNLVAGTYTVQVTDDITGCIADATVVITEPASAPSFTAVATNIFCTNDESQITVTANGGTPNYMYAAVVTGAAAPNVATDYDISNIVTVDTNSGADLVWDVYIVDANGCVATDTITVVSDPLPTVVVPPIPSNQCIVSTGYMFTVTGSGIPPLNYSINGGTSFQDSPTFTVNVPGIYTVTIMDGNGCTATGATNLEVFPVLAANATLIKNLTCSIPTEAEIDVSISGGNAPYSYTVSVGGAPFGASTPVVGNAFTFNTNLVNTFQFEITDANGCTTQTGVITTEVADDPSFTLAQTQDILCNGDSNAAIDVTIDTAIGLPPYVINVNNDTVPTDFGTQTSGLPAGDYTITVTDANGCSNTDTITISQPDPIIVNTTTLPITCDTMNGTSQGSVIVNNVTGGVGPYNYFVTGTNGYDEFELNNFGTTSVTFDVVDFGLYEVNVVDANGCSVLIQDLLVASPPTDLEIAIDPTVDCTTGGTAVVTVTTPLATGPFFFTIYNGVIPPTMPLDPVWQPEDTPGSASATFSGLLPGVTYTFIVFDQTTGCTYFETATLAIPSDSTLTVTALDADNITCTGDANGDVSFTVNSIYGVPTDVNYQIFDALSTTPVDVPATITVPSNGSVTVDDFGTLPFGNYFVLITEITGPNAGCGVVTAPFNITESAFELEIIASLDMNANCNELGTISAVASNGTPPYQYQVTTTPAQPAPNDVNWAAPSVFNLAANSYFIHVIDDNDCIRTDAVDILMDPLPTINPIPLQCYVGNPLNISISGAVTIGTPSYSIGGAFQSSPDFTINAPGTYNLTIQDGNGCTASLPYVVQPQLFLDADLTQDLTCVVDASITLTPSGGTGTYPTLEVSFNGGPFAVIAGSPFTATLDGNYEFSVTDSQGCVAISNVVVVTPQTMPTLTAVQTNVSCNGGDDGSIVVTAANGIPPYQYSIDNGMNFQDSNVFNNLTAAGSPYNVVIRDTKDCDSPVTVVTITEPTPVTGTIDLTQGLTCDINNGTVPAIITVTPSGGTPDYMFSFDGGTNFSTNNVFTTTTPGNVTVVIRDSNGCTSTDIIENIPALDPPTDLDFTATPITCINTTSTVTVTATGGITPLTFTILSPASATGNTTGASSGIFTGLTADTYLFEVTDANSCTYQEAFIVDPLINIAVTGLLDSDVNCNGGTDGAVTFTVTGFADTYSYTINGGTPITGQTTATIDLTGLATSTQTIVVTDTLTSCTATATITVNEPPLLTLVETTNINANCNIGAQVTVTANGGTPNYMYAFVEDGVTPLPTDFTNSNFAVLDPAINTNWDVYVLDANNCETMIDVTIVEDPLPTVTVPTFADNQCTATTDFTFTVTGTGIATLEYSIDGGESYQTSPTFTVSTPGDYTVTIMDGNGCMATSPTAITIFPALGATAAETVLPSCANDDGEITITTIGGSGNYSYSISPIEPSISVAGNVFSGVPAGDYTITVTDTVTMCTFDTTATLDAATPVVFTATATDVLCNGDINGTISVDLPPSNDNPIYTFALIAPSPMIIPAQNASEFTNLPPGTYTVEVVSERGCSETQEVIINEPDAIVITDFSLTQYLCNAGTNEVNFASITITNVMGGSGNYVTYEFIRDGNIVQFGPDNTFIESDFLGGNYIVNVFDDNGCIGTTPAAIIINPYIELDTIDVVVDNAITCTNLEDITVIVNTNGGTPINIQYTVEDVVGGVNGGVYSQTNNTGIFTGLDIGNYIITVDNLDTGCTIQDVHFVDDPDTFDLILDTFVDVTCFDDNDGSVNVTFVDLVVNTNNPDEAGPFNYTVTDASGATVASGITADAGPITIGGLVGDAYTISATLVNSPFCEISKNFTINRPAAPLELMLNATSVQCTNDQGTITAVASGGWGTIYEFQLSEATAGIITPFSSTSVFTGLSAGDYTVTVVDVQGCEVSATEILTIPDPITADLSATPLLCFGDQEATITVNNVMGGQGSNYTYTLNRDIPIPAFDSGPQNSNVFSNLGAGTYTVTIRDGFNCEHITDPIIIDQPLEIAASLVLSSIQTCETDATLTLIATGGVGPYSYSVSENSPSLGMFDSFVTFDVPVGSYEYIITDANGCIANVSNGITIEPLVDVTVTLEAINPIINCVGDTTGAITATASGGIPVPYVYILQDEMGNVIPATQPFPGTFINLPAGTYVVVVENGDCNGASESITITEPDEALTAVPEVTNVTCSGFNNGMLVINATGGTGAIQYAISPNLDQFFDVNTFNNLAPGDYEVIVQDANGCFVTFTVPITEPDVVLLSLVGGSVFPEICEGDGDGEFTVEISGGTLPYSVSIDDPNGTFTTGDPTQTQFTFNNLSGGDHIIYVIDALGCESQWNIPFPDAVNISPTVIIEYGCIGNTPSNIVTVVVDESNTDLTQFTYSLNGGPFQADNVFENVPPGSDYTIEVVHTNTCSDVTDPFDVLGFDPLGLFLSEGGLNEIVATASGGSGGYQYNFNGEDTGTDNTFIITSSGTYVVTVTDSNGCTVTLSRDFEFIDICIPNYFTPNNDGVLDVFAPGCIDNFPNLTFAIFDRYGREVARLNAGQSWDGTYNGNELPTGDYWYLVKINDPSNDREFVGHFTLYR